MDLNIRYFKSKGVKNWIKYESFFTLLYAEPYFLEFGDNITVSSGVTFSPHYNSVSKIIPNTTDTFGKIKIGNNCFIGHGSIILPGVQLGENVIVGTGSVVTKSFKQGNGCYCR
ncbi:DapH/DapD/GlmU-related protein [Heyndrickxia ginsengihumi]|uniref:DapH/DapD/GlmU-related protein n=1 Tax=Heyndrickxia ginsengihumi TaxID=363870 RepID=UPI0025599BB4|nr:DapH/DapD/GlmU-related protein [Heyndrickxia ginsengihumi]